MTPVFDGHNDFLLRLLRDPARREDIWLTGEGKGHLDLPRMRKGGFAGGFFAVYIPSPQPEGVDLDDLMAHPPYALPLPDPVPLPEAQPVAAAMIGHLMWMERTGTLSICRSVAEIRAAMAAGRIAAVLHMEGAEAIGPDLDALHLWHAAGLRSLGPVWSRPTAFGHGVPFAFPASPDTGDGLSAAGKSLVRECNRLRIMLDLSHLNEKGFDDIARLSTAPLVATHSNAHAVTPSARNLTDRQLDIIRDSGGMVGLNFATVFLAADGRQEAFTGWDPVLRHLDHLIARLGEDHVGFGSDFDGATIPADLGDVAGLPRLLRALEKHGYDSTLIEKLAHRNWLAVLERTWGG
ncbi:dipeptidase [Phaeovulum vinaykumarii]|uniref:Dipeptidase AC. Metallo peptidase. MEROPS family M19 n=1 Tax=Phaeovulum vinaykumarii TaxID=407234 RepID=A0A1N7JLW9_9RHOB|nr:dipeptidase [Phaeovulum vinaykumarii]SIS50353.1 dipeptidase AC. Metallo peptidase. MEROPS family M19 [Phaeovulum vinaykumarii]SOB90226.1 dipeptidase AC [Phaeovulum vinaykumarii]